MCNGTVVDLWVMSLPGGDSSRSPPVPPGPMGGGRVFFLGERDLEGGEEAWGSFADTCEEPLVSATND